MEDWTDASILPRALLIVIVSPAIALAITAVDVDVDVDVEPPLDESFRVEFVFAFALFTDCCCVVGCFTADSDSLDGDEGDEFFDTTSGNRPFNLIVWTNPTLHLAGLNDNNFK